MNLNQPIFQITLPLMGTFVATVWAASWSQNKRLDDMSRRIDDVVARLARIETQLTEVISRVSALEATRWR